MNRAIYFPALVADVKHFIKKRKHWLFHQWLWIITLFGIFFWGEIFWITSGMFPIIFIVILAIALGFYIERYVRYQKQKKEGKVLFFKKKKSERASNFYWFLGTIFLSWMIAADGYLAMLIMCTAFIYLIRFLLYIPSIIFLAQDDELIISRKHKSKTIDFSYPNRLRFHNNRLLFIHPVEGEITWKDINMNRDAMHEIKDFLAENFGQEMVLNPTTGLPYVR
jgi:hypothetical protein